MRHEGPRGQKDGQGPPTYVVNGPEKYVTFDAKNHVRFKSHPTVLENYQEAISRGYLGTPLCSSHISHIKKPKITFPTIV
jgi:hypothetical protein